MPKFQPKLGQVDYTHLRRAPVINCVVKFNDKILIVKRSASLNFYPNYWNGISGFLDDGRSVEEKAKDELKEELGITEQNILSVKQGKVFEQKEEKYDKLWIVHPVLIEVNHDKIILDWEAQDFKWIGIEEVEKYNLLPGFDRVLEKLFSTLSF